MAGESGVPRGGGIGGAWVYCCDHEKDIGAVG